MKFAAKVLISIVLLFHSSVFANPYWDPLKVPTDSSYRSSRLALPRIDRLKTVNNDSAIDVLRIQVDWREADEAYTVTKMIVEPSGTAALIARSKQKPRLGSYLGVLKDNQTGRDVYYDSIGTGKEYRKLARAINLRFPVPKEDMTFELYAENPNTGAMEKVVSKPFTIMELQKQKQTLDDVEIKELALARQSPSIRVNIYAEGYLQSEKETFWQHAVKAVQVLQNEQFPGVDYMSFYGVFHASNQKLGRARDLDTPVPEYDSFLGLFYPYWDGFGRWYNVVYPTREDKFRQGLAAAAYDYPLILVNSSEYWGVGNYMSFTAIPAASSYFTYMLFHEFGHFFGLNEEYEGGGRTELEFAPAMPEPWSQNITFLTDASYDNLKWKQFVDSHVKLPTPYTDWKSSPPVYGAYRGGYADSISINGHSHKPGLNCVMETHTHFCDICTHAIEQVVQQSLGKVVLRVVSLDYDILK